MRLSKFAADALLLSVAIIWGITFPVVKDALSTIDPMWFLAVRFFIAGWVLMPFFWTDLRDAVRRAMRFSPEKPGTPDGDTLRRGVIIGFFLFAGYAFQTSGLSLTTSSKTAFITGLYLVIVPSILAFLHRRLPGIDVAFGVVLAATGLALMSLEGRLIPQLGDVLVLLCAFSFAGHIVLVDKLGPGHSAGALTIIQIWTASLLALVYALLFERPTFEISGASWSAILITGVFATSIAYLIQTSVQKFTEATHAALILALEPVFALLMAYFWTGETLTARGAAGAVIMFAGMMTAEFAPWAKLMRARRPERLAN